ncbi:MAG TPA: hypothetical protein VFW77_05030 [Candidatus Saccharimonadales bacterium]|nr:hypothetical protein [Candidatus Saccharimonadales bacterium]
MYGGLGAGAAATATTGAVLTLPNTGGSNILINLAISVGVGLLTWGVVYTRATAR